jgi:hypothetical protein
VPTGKGFQSYATKASKNRKMKKTPSKTSPKSGKRGCLCKDNTYNSKCCDGSLMAQGIGSITGTPTPPPPPQNNNNNI